MRKKNHYNLLQVLLLALLISIFSVLPMLGGGANTGVVSGTVELDGGLLLPGITIVAESSKLSDALTTKSDEQGNFLFKDLPAGKYSFKFKLEGMKTILIEGIKVKPGKTVTLHPRMNFASLFEEVVILGERKSTGVKPAPKPKVKKYKEGDVLSIEKPRLVKKVSPVYPQEALSLGLEGDIVIAAVIGEDGKLTNMKILEGQYYASLVTAAINALEQWQYQPWLINGKPSTTNVSFKITFKLKTK